MEGIRTDLTLYKQGEKLRTEFNCLTIVFSGGTLSARQWTSGFLTTVEFLHQTSNSFSRKTPNHGALAYCRDSCNLGRLLARFSTEAKFFCFHVVDKCQKRQSFQKSRLCISPPPPRKPRKKPNGTVSGLSYKRAIKDYSTAAEKFGSARPYHKPVG
jgi:hypothetical protein